LIKSKLGISVFSAMTSCCHLLQLQYQHVPLRVLGAIQSQQHRERSILSYIPCLCHPLSKEVRSSVIFLS